MKNTNPNKETATHSSPSNIDFKLAGLCSIVAFLLYANTITHSYVLDDTAVILQNEYVQQGISGIPKIFTSDIWHFENIQLGYYRPLSVSTFAIEHQLWGDIPQVSHFINVLLFALTAFFLCLLLIRVFKNLSPLFAVLILMLFAAHPIHTEVVANIKSRDEILSFLNLVLAAYSLMLGVTNRGVNRKWIALSFVFFYIAMLAKESALVGVILFPLLLLYMADFSWKKILAYATPFLLLVIVFQTQKYLALDGAVNMLGTELGNYPYTEPGTQLPSTLLIFAWCVKLVLVPHPLLYSYAYNQIPAAGYTSTGFIAGVLLASIIVFFLYKNLQKKNVLLFGLVVFVVTLTPAMGFVFLRGGILAERFLYAPVLGFAVVFVFVLGKISAFDFQKKEVDFSSLLKNGKLLGLLMVVFLLYSYKTITRNANWKDEDTLMSQDIQYASNNCQLSYHYGTKLLQQAQKSRNVAESQNLVQRGFYYLHESLRINPLLTEANFQIAQAQRAFFHQSDSAIFYYNKALLQNTRFPNAYYGLATLYEQENKQQLASYYYNKAVEMNPYLTEAVQLRDAHKKKTRLDVKEFPTEENTGAVDEGRDFAYYNAKGKELGQRGDFVNAIKCFEKAVELNPNSEEAYTNLSVCLGMTKDYEKCIVVLHKSLELNPNSRDALTNLSVIYGHIGNVEKSREYKARLDALNSK